VFTVNFAFLLDQLSLVMLLVALASDFPSIYSVGYMADDDALSLLSYLNLFMFFMLGCWFGEQLSSYVRRMEGVGLASYLLIGFYF